MTKKGKNVHVTPRSKTKQWAVKSEGVSRASRLVDTKAEAVKIARQQAKNAGSELVVHNADGKISQKDSHGRDPFPPKG